MFLNTLHIRNFRYLRQLAFKYFWRATSIVISIIFLLSFIVIYHLKTSYHYASWQWQYLKNTAEFYNRWNRKLELMGYKYKVGLKTLWFISVSTLINYGYYMWIICGLYKLQKSKRTSTTRKISVVFETQQSSPSLFIKSLLYRFSSTFHVGLDSKYKSTYYT